MVRAALVLVLLAALAVPAASHAAPAPATTDFGTVAVGTSGPTQPVTLAGPLAVGELSIYGTAWHAVTPLSTCERFIPAGSHCDLQLRFAPTVAGEYRGHISSDGAPIALLSGAGAGDGAPTGGIGTALTIGSLPRAFTAHVRAHRATAKHARRFRAAMRVRKHRHRHR